MAIVKIHDAKTNFSKLINQAINGEEIIIARGNRPLIRLTPYFENESKKRIGGQFKDLLHFSKDFDDPLPTDSIKDFYEGEI